MTSGSSRPYIELYDSSSSGGKFRVPEGGYNPVRDKSGAVNRTADGGIDHAVGAIYEIHQYNIWVRDTELESGYGDKEELKRLFGLNNPNGTPNNRITFYDHFGNQHTVLMIGQEKLQPATVYLSGDSAWFLYPVTLHFIPAGQ
jgi:hypothetical protein